MPVGRKKRSQNFKTSGKQLRFAKGISPKFIPPSSQGPPIKSSRQPTQFFLPAVTFPHHLNGLPHVFPHRNTLGWLYPVPSGWSESWPWAPHEYHTRGQ